MKGHEYLLVYSLGVLTGLLTKFVWDYFSRLTHKPKN